MTADPRPLPGGVSPDGLVTPARRTRLTEVRSAVLNAVIGSPLLPRSVRTKVLRLNGSDVHPKAYFGPAVRMPFTRDVVADEGAYVNGGCVIEGYGRLELGAKVGVAVNVTFLTTSHYPGTAEQRFADMFHTVISVGAGAWIGAGAIVMPGVRIGAGAVVGAGSVVTKDVEANCVYAGTPATFVRAL